MEIIKIYFYIGHSLNKVRHQHNKNMKVNPIRLRHIEEGFRNEQRVKIALLIEKLLGTMRLYPRIPSFSKFYRL